MGLNANVLDELSKEQLVQMVFNLKSTISKKNFRKVTNLRFYHLERRVNMNSQYSRRDTLEITGIPADVVDEKLEDEVIEIYEEAKAILNRQNIFKKNDIQAVHRIGKKGRVIVKVVNRKFVHTALVNGKKLKDSTRYGDNTAIYFNDSFIPDFGFLNFVIRSAHKNKTLYKYKVRNGVNFVQKSQDGVFVEIGHVNDLQNLGIEIPARE